MEELKFKSKKLIIIPAIMLLAALVLFYGMNNEGLKLDVDLAGGTQLVIDSDRSINEASLESTLSEFGASITTSRGLSGNSIIIKYKADVNTTQVLEVMEEKATNVHQMVQEISKGVFKGNDTSGQAEEMFILLKRLTADFLEHYFAWLGFQRERHKVFVGR